MAHLAGRIDEEEYWDRLFSGGEKQRIAFACVLINKLDIVIMDEATSALDEKGHHQILSLFHAELRGTTIFTVANRTGLEHFYSREIVLLRTQHVEAVLNDVRHHVSRDGSVACFSGTLEIFWRSDQAGPWNRLSLPSGN